MNEKQILIKNISVMTHSTYSAIVVETMADYLLENDIVPIVRCKDCKHKEKCGDTDDYFFCSDGERKETK